MNLPKTYRGKTELRWRQLPGIDLDTPARRRPPLSSPSEEIHAVRQLDRSVFARENHPRAIQVVLGDGEAVLAHIDRTYVRTLVKGLAWA